MKNKAIKNKYKNKIVKSLKMNFEINDNIEDIVLSKSNLVDKSNTIILNGVIDIKNIFKKLLHISSFGNIVTNEENKFLGDTKYYVISLKDTNAEMDIDSLLTINKWNSINLSLFNKTKNIDDLDIVVGYEMENYINGDFNKTLSDLKSNFDNLHRVYISPDNGLQAISAIKGNTLFYIFSTTHIQKYLDCDEDEIVLDTKKYAQFLKCKNIANCLVLDVKNNIPYYYTCFPSSKTKTYIYRNLLNYIVTNKNYSSIYENSDIKKYIEDTFGFKGIEDIFKSNDGEIYCVTFDDRITKGVLLVPKM